MAGASWPILYARLAAPGTGRSGHLSLHFLWFWNIFYEPLIYLHSPDNWTVAIGLHLFNALYTFNTHQIMAASVVMIIPSVLLFFFSQRIFTQGVVISGIKG